MTLHLPTTEAISLIKQNSGQTIGLKVVNENTINVGYQIQTNVPLLGHVSKNVDIDLIVDSIKDKDVFLHYSTGVFGGDTLVSIILSAIPILSKSLALEKLSNGGLVVHLNNINWIRDSLKEVIIQKLKFSNNTIIVDFSVKNK